MRIPLITDTDSRDGSSNKDERLTNVLVEIDSEKMACVRPGLNKAAETTGNGNGAVCFGGTLVNVFGATLGVIEPAEPDYTHIICAESTNTIWLGADWVGTELVGVGASTQNKIYQSSDDGATTTLVATAPVEPDFPNGIINKNGQLYILRYASGAGSVYRDNSDYGATWSLVGSPAVAYPCCVSGGNIYSLTVGEFWDEEIEDVTGFTVQVHTTTDLTSITASTSVKNIVGDIVSVGYGCMTIVDGVIHVLVSSTNSDLLYHFKYQGGAWSYTTQALANEYIPSSKRCFGIDGKIYFITVNASDEVTLRRIDALTGDLETYYALGVASVGSSNEQLIYNGTTLTVCLRFGYSIEYHHFSNITSLSHTVVTTAALDENAKYDFALIP